MTPDDLDLIRQCLNKHYKAGFVVGTILSVASVILFGIGLLPDFFFWGWTTVAIISLIIGVFSFLLVKDFRPEPIMRVLTEHPESIKSLWVSQITQRVNGIDMNRREEVCAACSDGTVINIPTDVVWARLSGERDNPTTRRVHAAILSVAANACAGPAPSPDGRITADLPLTFYESIFGGDKLLRFQSIPHAARCCERHVEAARATAPEQSVRIKTPMLLDDGAVLRLRETAGVKGEPLEDLYVRIFIQPHPVFSRRELDIDAQIVISEAEALAGTDLQVPTIHGTVLLRIPPGMQSGSEFRMPQQGVTHPKTGQRGDQFTTVRIAT